MLFSLCATHWTRHLKQSGTGQVKICWRMGSALVCCRPTQSTQSGMYECEGGLSCSGKGKEINELPHIDGDAAAADALLSSYVTTYEYVERVLRT